MVQITSIVLSILAAASVAHCSNTNFAPTVVALRRGDSLARALPVDFNILHPYLQACKTNVHGSPAKVVFNNDNTVSLSGLSSTCMTGIKELQEKDATNPAPPGPNVMSVNETITGPDSLTVADVPAKLMTVFKSMAQKATGGN